MQICAELSACSGIYCLTVCIYVYIQIYIASAIVSIYFADIR